MKSAGLGYYKSAMKTNGWTFDESGSMEFMLGFTKGDRSATINLMEDESTTRVSIMSQAEE